jgi:hypothetical protein
VGTLLGGSWPFILPGLLPVVAQLHTPLLARRGRLVWALLLGAIALLFVADVLTFDHTGLHTLEVSTLFERGTDGELHRWVIETITQPVWQWHIAVALWFGVTAVLVWLVRDREPRAPNPVPLAVVAFAWALVARLALEKSAAPQEIVWAVGVSTASPAIALFFGWHCGARGLGFGRLALYLLLANVLQRVLLVAIGYIATTRELGTHLDTHSVTEMTIPGQGVVALQGGVHTWTRTLLVPQLTFLVVFTTVAGLVVALLPWWLARRRAAAAAPA